MKTLVSISFEEAKTLAETAMKIAEERDLPIAVTIIDVTGNRLVTFKRDEAAPITPELSYRKAKLALEMRLDTIILQEEKVNVMDFGDGYSCFGGGFVLQLHGVAVGAVGISGLTTGQADHNLAAEAIIKWEKTEISKKESDKVLKETEKKSKKEKGGKKL